MSSPTLPDGVKIISVGEFTRSVKGLLEETFPSVWIAGEISNLARPSSGHIYLKLKDSEAVLSAVIWRAVAYRLRFEPRDGLEVIARGRLTVYPPRGEYQLLVDAIEPRGKGRVNPERIRMGDLVKPLCIRAAGMNLHCQPEG